LVRQVNEGAEAVARLNKQITAPEANGRPANDLRDTRAQYVKVLGKLPDTHALKRPSGSVDLLVGGHLLVAGDRASGLAVGRDIDGKTRATVGTSTNKATINDGRIAALLQQERTGVPGVSGRIDELARNLILEMNRLHST